MSLAPTPVDVEELFAYARTTPSARRGSDREVVTVAGRTPRRPALRVARAPGTALGRRLAELGLIEPAVAAAFEGEAQDAAGLLARAERVLRIETEVPSGHVRADHVAAQLAALAGAELRTASFEQIALDSDPEAVEDTTASCERAADDGNDPARISALPDEPFIPADAAVLGLCRLRAHAGLCTWEILAIDRGPWLDLPAILGLLNSVLRHAQSPIRFVVLRGHDATARVLAAHTDPIEAAVGEGLIELEGPHPPPGRRQPAS